MRHLVYSLLLLLPLFGFSQITKSELMIVSKNLKDSTSLYFRERLIFKYKMMPKSLDSIEAKHLYYGRNFMVDKVATDSDDFIKLADAFKAGEFEKCIQIAKKVYAQDPTNLDVILILLRSYDFLKDANNFSHHITQLRLLIDAIKASGDGKTEESAYVVNSVDDEYIFLNILNVGKDFTRKTKPLAEDIMDVWEKDNNKIYIKIIYLN